VRQYRLTLAIFVGAQLLWVTQESSGQLLDRIKAKNGRPAASSPATSQQRPASQTPAAPAATDQAPAADAAKSSPTGTGATKKTTDAPPRERNTPTATSQAKPAAPLTANRTKATTASTVAATPMISIETKGPPEINIGRRASFTITVRNDGNSMARDLVIQATLPQGAELAKADPKPDIVDQLMQYSIAELVPKAEHQIKFEIIPRQQGSMDFKTRASVSTSSSVPIQVRRPELAVKFSGPTETVFGETVTFKATITNIGDGPAEDVSIAQLLPAQAEGEIASVAAIFEQAAGISQLLPGQSHDVELPAVAESEGTMRAQILVRAADGLEAKAVAEVRVHRPSIKVTVMGPDSRPVQRAGGYVVFIANTGEIPVTNVVVTVAVPEGLGVAAIQKGSTFDKKSNTLTWKLEKLEANATETLKFQAKGLAEGEQSMPITVVGDHATRSETIHVTRITGKAELLITVDEHAGPLEVGTRTEYGIRIKNCGTKPARKIRVRAQLPAGLEAVASDAITVSGNTIEFSSIDELAVGETTVLSLNTVGVEPGDQVIQLTLRCDALANELSAETSTVYYKTKK